MQHHAISRVRTSALCSTVVREPDRAFMIISSVGMWRPGLVPKVPKTHRQMTSGYHIPLDHSINGSSHTGPTRPTK
jgi:hypothetical protein